jgi:FkbM family methyltransferase
MDLGLGRKLRKLVASTRTLGFANGMKLILYSKMRSAPWDRFTLDIPGIKYPVHGRTGTSDPWVLQQIFLEREYASIDDEQEVRFVLDCGANAGYSSIYFLNRFPGCRVLAVEADPENAAVLRANLEPYGDSAHVIVAGVWSSRTDLVVVRRGEAWATQVRAARAGEKGDLEAVDIPTLLSREAVGRVDLLKMDIEGSEGEVFSADVHSWLPRVRTALIEIHDKRSEEIVLQALAGYDCTTQISGELWIFRNLRQKQQPQADQVLHG